MGRVGCPEVTRPTRPGGASKAGEAHAASTGVSAGAGPRIMLNVVTNEAPWERILRICLGIAMLAIGWAGWVGGVWGLALEIFGWVPLLTGALGWCPIYAVLGLRTARASDRGFRGDSR